MARPARRCIGARVAEMTDLQAVARSFACTAGMVILCAGCPARSGSADLPQGSCITSDLEAGRLRGEGLSEFSKRLRVPSLAKLLYVRLPCIDHQLSSTMAFIVGKLGSGATAGMVVVDHDRDGAFVAANSGGLDPPVFKSIGGRSAVGVSFFSSRLFAFAAFDRGH